MRLPNALASFALLCPLLLAQAPKAGSLPALLARVRAIRDATDFRASGRLVAVLPSGQRKSYQLSLRARAFSGILKLFCEVTDPAPARVRLLLESRAGSSAIRLGHAGDPAPRELDFESWAGNILETDFAYEDLMENQFLWRNQSLVEQTRYGARTCSVLRSTPGPADRTHYSAVTTWLDQATDYPVKVEKTVRLSGIVKEFIYYGLRQSKGVWSASQIECRSKGKPGSSLLIVSRGSEKANLPAREFDPALLIRP
ncbi:MAG: outer membrane lipoprotein-sorting protein [Bryobacteraceae bacterium]|jgi:hypothetical protein